MSLAERTVSTSSGHALTLLYKEHAADAFRYAVHLTGRRADAEDIVQQVFLQAYRHLESGRELVSPRAWLLTAVKHRAFNLARDRREVPVDAPVVAVESRDASGDEAAQLAEVRGMLWTLPEPQHHAFVLRHWSGLSQNEIADVLETTPSAVESLLGRARLTLLRAHDTASDACSQVRSRLLESTETLGGADLAHLGACRPCRQAHDRLMRAANVAGALALVPGTHVAHSIAGLVPGFSAHAATSTAAAVGGAGGAGAGATGVSTGLTTTTTAATATAKVAVVAKAAVAVVAASAAVGAVPSAHHALAALIAAHTRTPPSASTHHGNSGRQRGGSESPVAGSPTLPTTAPPNTGGANAGSHRPAQNPGHHGGAGQGLGKPATPGSGKPRRRRSGRTATASEAEATGRPSGSRPAPAAGTGTAAASPPARAAGTGTAAASPSEPAAETGTRAGTGTGRERERERRRQAGRSRRRPAGRPRRRKAQLAARR